MSGLRESFSDRIEFVVLDIDDSSLSAIRQQLGITAQAQYVLVNSEGQIVQKWFGVLDQSQVASDLESLLQT